MNKQGWINAGLAALAAVALVVGVLGYLEASAEYQVMSASGYLFSLEDGTGTVRFSVSDAGAIDGLGAIDADGAATLNSTLDVDGATTLNSTLDVDGNVSSGTGAVTVTDALTVSGPITLASNVNALSTVDFDSTLNVDGAATVDSLDVDNGNITLQNDEQIDNSTDTVVELTGFVALDVATTLNITTGDTITPTASYQPLMVDGSGAAATTDSSTAIADGAKAGQLLVLVNRDDEDVVIKNGANTLLSGDITLTASVSDTLMLAWDGEDWVGLSMSDN